ncbi:hypothetical protein J2X69_000257 [Algoriphagus sp. 4150]|uniref:hypothetical protein n=1 Tax=Algoriphagus sp. 4150 TaxID=2817756 RepID=UPI002866EB6B|nr:hypothetical protein [Algoriphagus sp. 4150]MDR7127929.1 hypothetical protein [Algoriphagus sp. 4150]
MHIATPPPLFKKWGLKSPIYWRFQVKFSNILDTLEIRNNSYPEFRCHATAISIPNISQMPDVILTSRLYNLRIIKAEGAIGRPFDSVEFSVFKKLPGGFFFFDLLVF